MNPVARHYLRGAGSVMTLLPNRSIMALVPRQTGAERMAARFGRIGDSLRRACGENAQHDSDSQQKTV